MYPYVVVEFLNNDDGAISSTSDEWEADIVPHMWLMRQTQSYWPPFRKNEAVVRAQITGATPDPVTWPIYGVKVVCAAGKA